MNPTNTELAGDWLQTQSGVAYWPLSPRAEDVRIEDIAHALSNLCRFGGHCRRFYSVAEHSVLVSLVVPPEHAMQALLHDATEAYMVDVPRPLKKFLSNYEDIEDRNWRVIAEHFGVPYDMHPSVKHADNTVLLAEKEELLGPPPHPWEWAKDLRPAPVYINCFTPEEARRSFLRRYSLLKQLEVVHG